MQGSPVSSSLSDAAKTQLAVTNLSSRSMHAGHCHYVSKSVSQISQHLLLKTHKQMKIMWKRVRKAAAWILWCSAHSYLSGKLSGAGDTTGDGQLPLLNLLRTETWGNFHRMGWHCHCWDPNLNSFWSERAGQKDLMFSLGHRCVCICLLLTFSYSPVIRRLSLQCVEIIPQTILPSACLLLNWNLRCVCAEATRLHHKPSPLLGQGQHVLNAVGLAPEPRWGGLASLTAQFSRALSVTLHPFLLSTPPSQEKHLPAGGKPQLWCQHSHFINRRGLQLALEHSGPWGCVIKRSYVLSHSVALFMQQPSPRQARKQPWKKWSIAYLCRLSQSLLYKLPWSFHFSQKIAYCSDFPFSQLSRRLLMTFYTSQLPAVLTAGTNRTASRCSLLCLSCRAECQGLSPNPWIQGLIQNDEYICRWILFSICLFGALV